MLQPALGVMTYSLTEDQPGTLQERLDHDPRHQKLRHIGCLGRSAHEFVFMDCCHFIS